MLKKLDGVVVLVKDTAKKCRVMLPARIYLIVDDVDETYKELLEKGLKPSSEPRDWPWGNREFVIRDPDGYKLVFYREISNKPEA